MKLDRVVFRYIADTNARFQALKAGEGQVMEPQGQLQIADFLKDSNFKVESKAGYSYEHLDMQFGPKGAPALRQQYVRQALMQGINRSQIASALWQTIAPGLPVLNSLIFKTFETGYTPHFKKYPFSQAKVIQILKGKGCTGGPDRPSAGNNNIFSCPGVGKLSFRFSTTAGNQLRALTFEIIQRQLKSVGIELVPRFQPAGLLFGTTLPSSDWDIIMFTWVQSPSSKITSKDLYGCGGEQNYMNYCNRKVTAPAEQDRHQPGRGAAHEAPQPGRGAHRERHPVDPDVRAARLRDQQQEDEGHDGSDHARREPLERERLDDLSSAYSRVTRQSDCLNHRAPLPPRGGSGAHISSESDKEEDEMLQYVIRRLLYSIVVLVVASFLTFTFVAKTGDPLAPLAITPNVSPETVAERPGGEPPRQIRLRPLLVLGEGRDHEPVRNDPPR